MNLFSGVLGLCVEKRAGKGEDSYSYKFDKNGNGYIAVFDGSGGAGSETHKSLNDRKSAYMASRCGSYIFDEAMKKHIYEASELSSYMYNKLIEINELFPMNENKSTMVDVLPTTLSSVLINNNRDLTADFMWAGDSRGYIIDENGIAQITEDDVDSEDAYYNLYDDSIMSNRIHGNKNKEKFVIHSKRIKLYSKAIVFCASDGCYDYFKSPMVFEFFILTMLMTSDNFDQAKAKIHELLDEKSGDDYTLVMSFYGFNKYSDVKAFLEKRFEVLNGDKEYFDEDYWNNKYKKNYYRFR